MSFEVKEEKLFSLSVMPMIHWCYCDINDVFFPDKWCQASVSRDDIMRNSAGTCSVWYLFKKKRVNKKIEKMVEKPIFSF